MAADTQFNTLKSDNFELYFVTKQWEDFRNFSIPACNSKAIN